VLTRRRIAELAFEAVEKRAKISSISPGAFTAMTKPVALVNRRLHALCAFGAAVSTIECVAPRRGRRSIRDYFAERVGRAERSEESEPAAAMS
jgi:hypothetical protein